MNHKINCDLIGVGKIMKTDLITIAENAHWTEVANLVK
jgi:hypothetical protein